MRIRKQFRFEAAHVLPNHKGKCSRLHGHSYRLEVELDGPLAESGPSQGMVLDFFELSAIVNSNVLQALDHVLLNDFIDNPTCERVLNWINFKLTHHLPNLRRLVLWETEASCAVLDIAARAETSKPTQPEAEQLAANRDVGQQSSQHWNDDWDAGSAERLRRIHEVAKASLTSVQALTEYEDGKVARILTIVAFLSAIIGAVFTRFNTDYPWFFFGWRSLIGATYLLFFLYVTLVGVAAALLIYAIRPTFNIPLHWKSKSVTFPSSLFFYRQILKVPIDLWRNAYIELARGDAASLVAFASRNYVDEAYYIAEKIAQKLKTARVGFASLLIGLCVLVVFLILFALCTILVSPVTHATHIPSTSSAPTPNVPMQSHRRIPMLPTPGVHNVHR